MKCPNCGKKMKKTFCTKCGYNPNGNALPNGSKVNYFTYDPNNPNVVYPLTVSGVAQANPSAKAPLTKKETKLAAKKAKLDLKALPKKERKIVQRAAKREAEIAASVLPPKNAFSRWLGLIVAVFSVLVLAVLSYNIVTDITHTGDIYDVPVLEKNTLLGALTSMLNSGSTILGILPGWPIDGKSGILYSVATYVFAASCVIAIVYALGALLSREKAPKRARKALFFLGMGAFIYAVGMALVVRSRGGRLEIPAAMLEEFNLLKVATTYVDINVLLIAVAGLVLSLLIKLFKKSK